MPYCLICQTRDPQPCTRAECPRRSAYNQRVHPIFDPSAGVVLEQASGFDPRKPGASVTVRYIEGDITYYEHNDGSCSVAENEVWISALFKNVATALLWVGQWSRAEALYKKLDKPIPIGPDEIDGAFERDCLYDHRGDSCSMCGWVRPLMTIEPHRPSPWDDAEADPPMRRSEVAKAFADLGDKIEVLAEAAKRDFGRWDADVAFQAIADHIHEQARDIDPTVHDPKEGEG